MKKILFGAAALVLLFAFAACDNDSTPETPPPALFVGDWKSVDDDVTLTAKADGNFDTKIQMQSGEVPISGTYTVSSDGRTATTSDITLPASMGGQTISFTMELKEGEDDVVSVDTGSFGKITLVKKSESKPVLTGTWGGKVVVSGNAEGEIKISGTEAALTVGGTTIFGTLSQSDTVFLNFFTIAWEENNVLRYNRDTTGLISAYGKAWLDDGSVFTQKSKDTPAMPEKPVNDFKGKTFNGVISGATTEFGSITFTDDTNCTVEITVGGGTPTQVSATYTVSGGIATITGDTGNGVIPLSTTAISDGKFSVTYPADISEMFGGSGETVVDYTLAE